MKTQINALTAVLLVSLLLVSFYAFKMHSVPDQVYQFRQFTSVESIIQGGVGRSRIISSSVDGQDIGKDLLNLYSMTGINFKNVASNDQLVVSTINDYSKDGWELVSVTAGVQSPSGTTNSQGIFMTRYLFRKPM